MAFCRLFCMIGNCVLSYKKALIECAKAYFFYLQNYLLKNGKWRKSRDRGAVPTLSEGSIK